MITLQISEQQARKMYSTASKELKEILEASCGKEVLSGSIMDRVKTYEDACKELGREPYDEKQLEKLGLTKNDIAYQKMVVIVEALNEGWKPDWDNYSEAKYYPWFEMSPSSFAFTNSTPIKEALEKIPHKDFPFLTTIRAKKLGVGNSKMYYFT